MKTQSYILLGSIFICFNMSTLIAQINSPFYGEWQHVKGNDLFKEINVLNASRSSTEPILVFHYGNEKNKRIGGEIFGYQDSLICDIEIGTRLFKVLLQFRSEKLLLAKIIMSADKVDFQETFYAYYRKKKQRIPESISIMQLNMDEIEESPKNDAEFIKEVKIIRLKGKIEIDLENCKNCGQYSVLIKNEKYQKSGIPNKNGKVRFSEVPFGKYKITVHWKGKMDRPDRPPYKSKPVSINQSKLKKVSIPKK